MSRSLAPLIKQQSMKVDEQRRHLARLVERVRALGIEIDRILQQQKDEHEVVRQNPAAALTFGAYTHKTLQTVSRLQDEQAVVLGAIELARSQLAELFEEQKRYELAETDRIEAERREKQRQDMRELDEIGSVGFVRNRGRKTKR